MSKFWPSLEAACKALGTVFTENQIIYGRGSQWPQGIRSAHGADGTRLHYVDCYGWCRVTED
jgi:hypothetical protein